MFLETALEEWIGELAQIEADSFPEDEKADFSEMLKRCKEAPAFFQVLLDNTDRSIVGYINATLCGGELTEETMSQHDPDGITLIIHSCTIRESARRKGHATKMMKDYLRLLTNREEYRAVRTVKLLSKAHLLEFYISNGFKVERMSPVDHGKETWFELSLNLFDRKRIDIYTVDSFTNKAFNGENAIIVFLSNRFDDGLDCHYLNCPISDPNSETTTCCYEQCMDWINVMSNELISTQRNSNAVAFVKHINTNTDGPENEYTYQVRWFTPSGEVELSETSTVSV
jgi:GNAT superfamily N-acetyltransferase